MFIISILMLSFLSILCVCSLLDQQSDHDINCRAKGGILCIKEELDIIATIADGITRKSMEIEKQIHQRKTLQTLNKKVEADMNYTRLYLPTLHYHKDFFLHNNIDKEYLTRLVIEGHDAMLFFYNSINDLLDLQDVFSYEKDQWFKKIRNNIKDDIICRYRSVLNVFSKNWTPMNQIGRMHFIKKHLSPSLTHDVHSLVIARYLREWMQQIDKVIKDLEKKYF